MRTARGKPQRPSSSTAIVVDTGPLVAIMNAGDDDHELCVQWLTSVNDRRLILPVPVLIEVCQLLESRVGPHVEAEFLSMLADSPQFVLYSPDMDAVRQMGMLVTQYADFPLGAADASVVVAAEQYGTASVATLDRRHFLVIKPTHVESFDLQPGDYFG